MALALAAAVGLPLVIGFAGSLISAPGIRTWYPTLTKPSWNPPASVFGPVWSVLYTAMGYASYRVWRVVGLSPSALWITYGVQLALNAAWNPLMFAGQKIDVAMADIVALLIGATATAVKFGRVDAVAGRLMVPYVAWVGFATALNGALWRLNPTEVLFKGKARTGGGGEGAPLVGGSS
ncbi:hypothetical protein BU14_0161s0030 [Porphyra umbilicalis]|uniref:TspO/MBR-related protein n=1 Tax=Porphyra umbilicalis TaxID=2786 RepID=A0A1X6P8M1_PORUM|nr:hypothetical protein BU14_0161s0030 [Porphyra umbilicalis]|eukprot:OSX77110.1 hypothetical protein BU14_0161s0030 [Porphyra umbilicalis]